MATAKEFLQSDHESVVNDEEVEEDDATLDIKKRKRDIAEWIVQPRKPPSRNEDEESEGDKEDFGATQASKEDNSSIDEYEEGREYKQEDDCEDTGISDAKNKLHRRTKANRHCRFRRRGLTTTMMMMTEPVPKTTTNMVTATAEVTGISAT